MTEKKFFEDEIPYGVLSRFGLTEEMIEDLPKHALDKITTGHRSPVLPIRFVVDDNKLVECRSRFRLVRADNGDVQVLFSPKLDHVELTIFDKNQQVNLNNGKPICASVPMPNGGTTERFFQVDPITKQVLSVPLPVINYNLRVLLDKFRLNTSEMTCLSNGDPLTIYVDDKPVTMGIDLDSEHGIRVMAADEDEWRESSKREWDKYTFGISGCWVMDDDGNLDYVNQEDYTDELWNEMRKAAQRNVAAHRSM